MEKEIHLKTGLGTLKYQSQLKNKDNQKNRDNLKQ